MTSPEQTNEVTEMQQIGAYPTKHKPYQQDVPLLQTEEESGEPAHIPATQDRAQ
ncbi:hypothetical protein G3578_12355 [Brevibacillus sp. SYP-B805]|uniref:hypothetical protein n=1 Tax=Brevibacillus sp. SYP-B805 TaxID=1578199 RepID=UPI0013EA47AD|nr:hypothetical protein [Brevibacillus sp. SYP-B805]NGQ95949.1 hypothetical protein [Brevibacillus sp. SYP-B805]